MARVLLIDDDNDFLRMASVFLEGGGHQVEVLNSGFGVTNRVAGADTRPDVIVLDGMMPALSGESVLAILQKNERTRDVPVVFYSNTPPPAGVVEAIHGNVRQLTKGKLSELRDLIERIVPPATTE